MMDLRARVEDISIEPDCREHAVAHAARVYSILHNAQDQLVVDISKTKLVVDLIVVGSR